MSIAPSKDHPDTGYRGNLVKDTKTVNAWLAGCAPEPALEPELPIIDSHTHFWDLQDFGSRYLFDDMRDDVMNCGHNIEATVFIEAAAMYRANGPEHLRSLGEVEFARGMAAMADSGLYGTCRMAAVIVGQVDLRLGDAAGDVLDAAVEAAGGRFRGVRHQTPFDSGEIGSYLRHRMPEHLLRDPGFQLGAAQLVRRNLSLDVWLFHPQLEDVAVLARALPDLRIVVNHVGGPLGVGPYQGKRDEVFSSWRAGMEALAQHLNVHVKLGGMGMPVFGNGLHLRGVPPDSQTLATTWKPVVDTCIELFGASRCMFESNFPVDKQAYGYSEVWNAFKRLTHALPAADRAQLFKGTAARIYRMDDKGHQK
ncbi:amidohydrolase family protein [Hydrogenophaga palleronii]|uniref:amidohydrolase family protein n=1 Tax=Hydrogenophaga palleronii TaxID=65655 RepID=UPI000AFDEA13|nr:amidohydrolase family protein [Hydrogenophaga palleronii]